MDICPCMSESLLRDKLTLPIQNCERLLPGQQDFHIYLNREQMEFRFFFFFVYFFFFAGLFFQLSILYFSVFPVPIYFNHNSADIKMFSYH